MIYQEEKVRSKGRGTPRWEAAEVVTGNKEMAKKLNRYFALVFTVEDTSSIPELQKSQGAEVIAVAINKEKVLGKQKFLKVNKSPRPDVLHPRVLKEI
eukprot:g46006.t1